MSTEALTTARLHALESSLTLDYCQQTVEEHAECSISQRYVVTCLEMLEHVPNPASVVRACARLVKPGGEVFFATLNRNTKAWLMVIIGAEYVLRLM